jgi:hypothetical protein
MKRLAFGAKHHSSKKVFCLKIRLRCTAQSVRFPRLMAIGHLTRLILAISDALGSRDRFHVLPLGVIVCSAMPADALPAERILHDRFGDYSPGRRA